MKEWLCLIKGYAREATFVKDAARFSGSYKLPIKVKKVKPAYISGGIRLFECYIARYP